MRGYAWETAGSRAWVCELCRNCHAGPWCTVEGCPRREKSGCWAIVGTSKTRTRKECVRGCLLVCGALEEVEPCRSRGFHTGMKKETAGDGLARRWVVVQHMVWSCLAQACRGGLGAVVLILGPTQAKIWPTKKLQFKPALGTNWALPWAEQK